MRQKSRSKSTGFTIIEVMIVLAIAALIMLIVLLAVRQLQRNRRDLQRKNFAGRIVASVIEFYSNNYHYPDPTNAAEVSRFVDNYIAKDPDPLTGKPYTLASLDASLGGVNTFHYRGMNDSHADVPPVGTIYVQMGHWCNKPGAPSADNATDAIAGNDSDPSRYAVWIGVEVGGYYCTDNFSN